MAEVVNRNPAIAWVAGFLVILFVGAIAFLAMALSEHHGLWWALSGLCAWVCLLGVASLLDDHWRREGYPEWTVYPIVAFWFLIAASFWWANPGLSNLTTELKRRLVYQARWVVVLFWIVVAIGAFLAYTVAWPAVIGPVLVGLVALSMYISITMDYLVCDD